MKKNKLHKNPGRIRRGTRVLLSCLIVLSFTTIVSWLVGLSWFYNQIPKNLKSQYQNKADMVVVLTGGGSRIDAGIAIMNQGLADVLFISGVGKGVTLQQLLAISGFNIEQTAKISENKDSIILGKEAINTRENAEEVYNWIKKHRVESIYLVTANYHMPRALLEFHSLMPELKIIPYPAFPENFKADRWDKDSKSAWFILLEYTKYLAAALRIYLKV